MRLTLARRAYLRANYRLYTDAALAKILDAPPAEVRAAAKRLRLKRTPDDVASIHRGSESAAPVFDGQMPRPRGLAVLSGRDLVMAGVTALAILGVYIATLPPTVTGEDSGEFITAAYTLGIPHPPGYPAWCLLAHPFTYLPLGTVAWRVALSSAVFGAAAAFFLYLTTLKLCRSHVAAAAAALLFAFSKDAWEQFVIAEIYALNALFFAACVFLLLVWYESRRKAPLLIFAFLYGLSLANHSTARLLGPAFLLFVLYIDPVPWKQWRLYAGCVGLSLVGLSAFLYLPLRSAADPPVDWGNPETWDNFWAVVRQDQFAFLLTQHKRSIGLFGHQLLMFWNYFKEAFTPFLVGVPLLGLYPLWRTNRLLFSLIAGLAALLSVGLILILNYGTDRTALVVNDVFFIPFHAMVSVIAGVGIAWLMRLRVRGISLRPAAAVLAVACVVTPLVLHYRVNDKSRYWFAYDYGRNILTTLEPNAIYMPGADHATFPVIYLQSVEGLRPDVTIGNKYGYPEQTLYAGMPKEIREEFHSIPTNNESRLIEEWIVLNTERPVYFTEKRSFPERMSAKMENAGLAYRVVKKGQEWQSKDFWSEYTWHTLDPEDAAEEFTAGLVLADFYFARGRDELVAGDRAKATEYFETSARASHNAPENLNNIGTALAERGDLEGAAEYYLRSLETESNYITGLRNLGQVYMSLEKYGAAALVLDRLKRSDPKDLNAELIYIACLRRLGRFDEARKDLLALAKVRPDDAMIYRELGMLFLNDLGDPLRGRQYLMRSLRLDPSQQDLVMMINDPKLGAPNGIPGPPGVPGLPNPLPNFPGITPQ